MIASDPPQSSGPSSSGPSSSGPSSSGPGSPRAAGPRLPILTRQQCRGARAMLGWSQADLAARTRISAVTIRTFERGHSSVKDSTARVLRFVFEEGGIVFVDATEGIGPGVCLARHIP